MRGYWFLNRHQEDLSTAQRRKVCSAEWRHLLGGVETPCLPHMYVWRLGAHTQILGILSLEVNAKLAGLMELLGPGLNRCKSNEGHIHSPRVYGAPTVKTIPA